jgi:hypothetical protein
MKKNANNKLESAAHRTQEEINTQAANVLALWKANREFRMRDIKFEDFAKMASEYGGVVEKIDAGNRELHALRVTRDRLGPKVERLISRARSGMRGYFGPHSSEYQRVRAPQPQKAASEAGKPAPVTPGK